MSKRTEIEKLPALRTAWRIAIPLFGALAGIAVGFVLTMAFRAKAQLFMNVAVNALVWAGAGWIYAGRAYDAFGATLVEGEGVIVRKGVWWRAEIMVPISRLQHIDVNQNPLDRRWNMARLTLHTAGTHDKGTRIYGLPLEHAHALRNTLLPRQPLVHD